MLHNETRKLLIEAWNKTYNAKEIAECFSVDTKVSQRGRKPALSQTGIQNIDQLI